MPEKPRGAPARANALNFLIEERFAVFEYILIFKRLFYNLITWYGSINLLSFGYSEERIMRLESSSIARELTESMDWELFPTSKICVDRLLQNANFLNFCVGEKIYSSEYCMYACDQIYFSH